jgi:hypothetical protein
MNRFKSNHLNLFKSDESGDDYFPGLDTLIVSCQAPNRPLVNIVKVVREAAAQRDTVAASGTKCSTV